MGQPQNPAIPQNIKEAYDRASLNFIDTFEDTGEEESEYINFFIECLKAEKFEIFKRPKEDFKPQNEDLIFGSEDDAVEEFSVYRDGVIYQKYEGPTSWKEYYEQLGPEGFDEWMIVVARYKGN